MYAVYTHRAVPVCKYSLKIEMCVFALLQLLLQQNHHLLISAKLSMYQMLLMMIVKPLITIFLSAQSVMIPDNSYYFMLLQ